MNGLELMVYNVMTIIQERRKRKTEETEQDSLFEKNKEVAGRR